MVPSLGIPGEFQEQRSNEGKQRAEEIVERIQKVIFRPVVDGEAAERERRVRSERKRCEVETQLKAKELRDSG